MEKGVADTRDHNTQHERRLNHERVGENNIKFMMNGDEDDIKKV